MGNLILPSDWKFPYIDNAITAVDNSPAFQETRAKKTYLVTVKNELDTAFNPTVVADGGMGRRSFESTASDGSTVRTTGNFFEQSITGQKMLYDFGVNDLQKRTAQYDILAVDSQIKNIQSELLLEALEAFMKFKEVYFNQGLPERIYRQEKHL